jgi:hypothetical protein
MPHLTNAQKDQFIRDGFVRVPGLIPDDIVASARQGILAALGIDADDPATWAGKAAVLFDPSVRALTEPCRNDAVEAVAEELVGPGFVRGRAFSPYIEARAAGDPLVRGYIPVLNFPEPGPKVFVRPAHYHIDGMHRTTLWPDKHFLVVFAYLSDVAEYGGATTVLPGSHRQVFEHWAASGHPGSTDPPRLDYAEPTPVAGRAGDVIFMHYLLVHSGSANRSTQIRVGLNTAVLPDPERPYRRKPGPPGPDWTPLDATLRTDDPGDGERVAS